MNHFSFPFNRLVGVAAAVGVATVLVGSPLRAQAASITTFTDSGAWAMAADGGVLTENFDGVRTGNRRTLEFPNLSFVSVVGDPDSATRRLRFNNDRLRITIDPDNADRFDTVKVVFSTPVNGFGAEFFNVDPGLMIGLDSFDTDIDVYQALHSASGGGAGTADIDGFFGIVSDMEFTEFAFSCATLNQFAIDDFSADVPTPALLPGLIGMGVAALRKRKGETAEADS